MAKLPTKVIGVITNYNNATLECKQDGEYQGVPKLKWFHKGTNEPAFRKINGQITFMSLGSGSPTLAEQDKQGVAWPELDKEFTKAHHSARNLEEAFTGLAVSVAIKRYPDLDVNGQTFGMIVNAINNRLVELDKK